MWYIVQVYIFVHDRVCPLTAQEKKSDRHDGGQRTKGRQLLQTGEFSESTLYNYRSQ